MTGRNSKPKNRGPAGHPGRLDQFGEKLADDTVSREAAEACDTDKRS
ncbi:MULTISPECIES: hypothetical protein [Paenibacillus]|uniref:Uncharacterized protein n=3 Tax=Paenibacillus mucilaginosus TaxID=61624 RepID=H6NIS6_9BACL|nr:MULTISPECIES: hypothetical protein [Paenibacillus]AEI45432.1 hypothetical protein KNP414_06920 [Paenibacillus mucilaginosus KNP414]AFC33143.1 hypothetical protein PM3016_6518 [Paenibacillus mucilaginosus 3016]AFH65457.1 hypothetical protein B2K_32935 [Paenibacillus mucilaginosus K02]MCG7215195.1 hypothetical protein [Paenibacillus mucilaginosus]MCZ8523203.1 hypothetical protein [Paenibacillus caseinilyticus]